VSETIVCEIPLNFKPVAEAVSRLAGYLEVQTLRCSRGGQGVDYGDVERGVAEIVAGIERASHETLLRALDIDAARIEVGGETYTHVGRSPGKYRTLAGEVEVDRNLYRLLGVRNGPTLDAISARAGAIGDGWLPGAAQAMAFLLQQTTSRDAAAASQELVRLPYSRASFENVPHRLAAKYLDHHADIEDLLVQQMEIPAEARSVSVSLDRVSVPMEEPRQRPVGRPRKNAPKRPVERVFRMAYCGTVTLHDGDGEALHTIRYGTMPSEDADYLISQMASDVFRLLERRPELQVVELADGAPELWNLMDAHLNQETLGAAPSRLIDFWHVIEKLAPAARCIYGDRAVEVLQRWRSRLRSQSGAAKGILRELRESGHEWTRSDGSVPVHEAITYLRNGQDRMNYATARQDGLPIGSGNIEATCKSLVAARMKRPGSRWKTETGEHVIKLRALAQSDRWSEAMEHFHTTQRRSVRVRVRRAA